MRYLPIILLTLLLGGACGYFQYWMDTRLAKKRWLLLFQPVLLGGAAVCFTAWTMSIKTLAGSPLRLAGVPFGLLLVCTLIGWGVGEWRRRRM